MKFKEIEKILKKDGWILKDIRGSHYQFVHNVKTGKVTIPNHKGDLPKATVKSIMKQAKITGVIL